MDTGRLGIVRRQENSRRKFVFMLNDVIKTQCEVVDECLSREKFEIGVKYDKSFVPVRRSVVKQRVLQQCLKMRRGSRKFSDRNLGVYGGKPLYTYSREIDKFIADMHPRHRRLRQAEKALKESIDKGKILDPQNIPHKIEQYFEKNWKPDEPQIKPKPKIVDVQDSKDIFKRTRHILPPIRGLLNPINKIERTDIEDKNHHSNEINIKNHENDHHEISDSKSKGQKHHDSLSEKTDKPSQTQIPDSSRKRKNEETSSVHPKGLLILPAIQQTKQMAER